MTNKITKGSFEKWLYLLTPMGFNIVSIVAILRPIWLNRAKRARNDSVEPLLFIRESFLNWLRMVFFNEPCSSKKERFMIQIKIFLYMYDSWNWTYSSYHLVINKVSQLSRWFRSRGGAVELKHVAHPVPSIMGGVGGQSGRGGRGVDHCEVSAGFHSLEPGSLRANLRTERVNSK